MYKYEKLYFVGVLMCAGLWFWFIALERIFCKRTPKSNPVARHHISRRSFFEFRICGSRSNLTCTDSEYFFGRQWLNCNHLQQVTESTVLFSELTLSPIGYWQAQGSMVLVLGQVVMRGIWTYLSLNFLTCAFSWFKKRWLFPVEIRIWLNRLFIRYINTNTYKQNMARIYYYESISECHVHRC